MNKKVIALASVGALAVGGGAAWALSTVQASPTPQVMLKAHPRGHKIVATSKAPTYLATAPTVTLPVVGTPIVHSTSANLRAVIDPTFTQNPSNPLQVTFTYSASITDGTLPTGTLSLMVTAPGSVSSSGGCTMDVGGAVYQGTCTVTLPYYGEWQVTTTYAGGVSGATSTETVNIPGVNASTGTTAPPQPSAPSTTQAPTTTTQAPTTTTPQPTTTTTQASAPVPVLSWGLWQIVNYMNGSGPLNTMVPTGDVVHMYAYANYDGNTVPGSLNMTFSPTSVTDSNGFSGAAGCNGLQNFANQASGECVVQFNAAGNYTVTLTFVPASSAYGTTEITQIVSVG